VFAKVLGHVVELGDAEVRRRIESSLATGEPVCSDGISPLCQAAECHRAITRRRVRPIPSPIAGAYRAQYRRRIDSTTSLPLATITLDSFHVGLLNV
jgi:hypothetical protein